MCLAPCAFPASPALECKDLASLKVPRTTIVSAELVEAGTFKPPSGDPLPELKAFCRVAGIATPSRDSDIKFEVWLPAAEWNGRLWGVGNGNFGGYMLIEASEPNSPKGTRWSGATPGTRPVPMMRTGRSDIPRRWWTTATGQSTRSRSAQSGLWGNSMEGIPHTRIFPVAPMEGGRD